VRRACGWELPFRLGDSSIVGLPDVTTEETVKKHEEMTGGLIRAQAACLRGSGLPPL
jgi:hypothetical protein